MSSLPAFDALAAGYDRAFTHTVIGRSLRQQVHARLERIFPPGSSALELGCGTGEDALHLAQRGVRVLATDASPRMLDIARGKLAGCPLARVERLDLRSLPQALLSAREVALFDGAFSNFGALNCLHDWQPLAAWLAAQIRPGGVAAFGVMSPLCLWEPLWHGLRGDWRTATRRWRQPAAFQPTSDSEPILIYYPSIRRLTRAFAPAFRRVHVQPLGVFLPTSDAFSAFEKRPRLLNRLLWLDGRLGRARLLASFADHYWIEFQRCSES